MKKTVSRLTIAALVSTWLVVSASAQVTPAAGYTPPDDNPSFKVGATIFGDYTYIDSPQSLEAFGRTLQPILQELGIAAQPDVQEVYKIIRG